MFGKRETEGRGRGQEPPCCFQRLPIDRRSNYGEGEQQGSHGPLLLAGKMGAERGKGPPSWPRKRKACGLTRTFPKGSGGVCVSVMDGPPSDKRSAGQETHCPHGGNHLLLLLLLCHCKAPRPGPGAAGRAGRRVGDADGENIWARWELNEELGSTEGREVGGGMGIGERGLCPTCSDNGKGRRRHQPGCARWTRTSLLGLVGAKAEGGPVGGGGKAGQDWAAHKGREGSPDKPLSFCLGGSSRSGTAAECHEDALQHTGSRQAIPGSHLLGKQEAQTLLRLKHKAEKGSDSFMGPEA